MQQLDELGYMAVGLATVLPCVLLPILLQPRAEAAKPWHQRYWVKANIWIAIFSFIGNYFWTHYFFQLLGAAYTFKSWRLNGVRTFTIVPWSLLPSVEDAVPSHMCTLTISFI